MKTAARIDVIGNANNYPLAIAHGLRTAGYDAHLHLTMHSRLNAPENRYPEYAQKYPEWIHDWRHLGDALWSYPAMRDAVLRAAAAADALVLNYDAVHLGAAETRPYFCLLTGTDLLEFADPQVMDAQIAHCAQYSLEHTPNNHYLRTVAEFCLRQRAAIRQARGYSFFPRGSVPSADAVLDSIGALSKRRSILITEVDDLAFSAPDRGGCLKVLYGARLVWDKSARPPKTEQDYKGTDIFVRGFADFIHGGGQAELTLFRKGDHIQQTEVLVAELGMADFVIWRDEANQRDYIEAVRNADVVADSTGTSHLGMVTVDAMSLGRPVIARAPDHHAWNWPAPLPICHAETAEDVAAWLRVLANDQKQYNAIASRAREFAEANLSPENVARRIAEALNSPGANPAARFFQVLTACGDYDRKNYDKTVCAREKLQGEHAALKGEHAALKGEYAALKGEHAALKGEYAALKFDYMGIKANARRLARALRRRFAEECRRFMGIWR